MFQSCIQYPYNWQHERLISGDPDPEVVKSAVTAALAKLTAEEKDDEEAESGKKGSDRRVS